MPYEDLRKNVQFVCRRWREIIFIYFKCPHIIRINEASSELAVLVTSQPNCKIFSATISDFSSEINVLSQLQNIQWKNLKNLSLRWKLWSYYSLGRGISVLNLNRIIDQCPKLKYVKLNECLLQGDMNILAKKLKKSKIRRFRFENRYLIVSDTEKLYNLENMHTFHVYCHYFIQTDILNCIQKFCANNMYTLQSLGLYLRGQVTPLYSEDTILYYISSCTQLVRLYLTGPLNVSAQGLKNITSFSKLRYLKLDISLITPNVLIEFLRYPLIQKLYGLKLSWNRNVNVKELEELGGCVGLRQLTLSFVDNHATQNIIKSAVLKAAKQMSKLRKLKLKSIFFHFWNLIPKLCRLTDLYYVKLTQTLDESRKRIKQKKLEKQLNLICSDFNYEYRTNVNKLEIELTKRR